MNAGVREFLELAKKGKCDVCIWGAGNIGTHFGLQMLKKREIAVDYYCDNNSNLWGTEVVCGIRCISPEEIINRNVICFVMVSNHLLDAVCTQVHMLGINKVVTYTDLCELEIDKYFTFKTRKQVAVYSCIVGDYDELKEPVSISPKCDYYIISDKKPEKRTVFQFLDVKNYIPTHITDNTRKNRYCKINAHKIFPQYRYSIYFDGNIQIKGSLEKKIEKLPKTRIMAFANNFFDSVYMEAMRAAEQFRDKKEVLMEQVEKYWLEGMPEDFGSVTCGVLIREHNNPICRKIMEEWWEQVEKFSKRDQVSFPYVLWKNGYSINDIDTINGDKGFCETTFLTFDKEHLQPRVNIPNKVVE